MRHGHRRSQRAFGLIEVVIALGVAAMGAMVVMHLTTNSLKAQQHLKVRGDLTDIKNQLLNAIDCKNTFGPSGSASASTCHGTVTLMSHGTNPKPVSSQIGPYTILSTCQAGQGLMVQAAKLKPGAAITTQNSADFYTDHLTGKPLSWANGTLFAYTDGLCGSYFTSTTTSVPTGGCNPSTFPCVASTHYLTQTGDLAMYPSWASCGSVIDGFSAIHAVGLAMCPTGWRPTGSVANCQFTGNTVEAGTGEGGGNTLASSFTSDSQGVSYDCCAIVLSSRISSGIIHDGYLSPAGQGGVMVACVPEQPP